MIPSRFLRRVDLLHLPAIPRLESARFSRGSRLVVTAPAVRGGIERVQRPAEGGDTLPLPHRHDVVRMFVWESSRAGVAAFSGCQEVAGRQSCPRLDRAHLHRPPPRGRAGRQRLEREPHGGAAARARLLASSRTCGPAEDARSATSDAASEGGAASHPAQHIMRRNRASGSASPNQRDHQPPHSSTPQPNKWAKRWPACALHPGVRVHGSPEARVCDPAVRVRSLLKTGVGVGLFSRACLFRICQLGAT